MFHDSDWIARVDHNDNNDEEDDDEEHHHEARDDKVLEEEEQIDQDKVNDITSDTREEVNPTTHEEEDQSEQLAASNGQ